MNNITVTIEEAKTLWEMGLITQDEYMSYVQIKVEQVREIVAAKALDYSDLLEADRAHTSITMN